MSREFSNFKDYYKILGLPGSCSGSDIKKAYHKLALKYHPDKNKSPGTEEKFKEVAEAYVTLKEADKKKVYDIRRERWQWHQNNPAASTAKATSSSSSSSTTKGYGDVKKPPPSSPNTSENSHGPYASGRHKFYSETFRANFPESPDSTPGKSGFGDSKKKAASSQQQKRYKWNREKPPWNNSFSDFREEPEPFSDFTADDDEPFNFDPFEVFKQFFDDYLKDIEGIMGLSGLSSRFNPFGRTTSQNLLQPSEKEKILRAAVAASKANKTSRQGSQPKGSKSFNINLSNDTFTQMCSMCKRHFNLQTLIWHEPICKKLNKKFRQRLEEEEEQDSFPYRDTSNWRSTHEDLLNTIRRAKHSTREWRGGDYGDDNFGTSHGTSSHASNGRTYHASGSRGPFTFRQAQRSTSPKRGTWNGGGNLDSPDEEETTDDEFGYNSPIPPNKRASNDTPFMNSRTKQAGMGEHVDQSGGFASGTGLSPSPTYNRNSYRSFPSKPTNQPTRFPKMQQKSTNNSCLNCSTPFSETSAKFCHHCGARRQSLRF